MLNARRFTRVLALVIDAILLARPLGFDSLLHFEASRTKAPESR